MHAGSLSQASQVSIVNELIRNTCAFLSMKSETAVKDGPKPDKGHSQ